MGQLQHRVEGGVGVGAGETFHQAVGREFDSDLLHMPLIPHILFSRQSAEAQEPKLSSAASSKPLRTACLLIFSWQVSHIAKPSISRVRRYTPLTLLGDNAKEHGRGYGCVILV